MFISCVDRGKCVAVGMMLLRRRIGSVGRILCVVSGRKLYCIGWVSWEGFVEGFRVVELWKR